MEWRLHTLGLFVNGVLEDCAMKLRHWHWVNRNDKPDRSKGPPTEGSLHLYFDNGAEISVSWAALSNFTHAYMQVTCEGLKLSVAQPLLALWFDVNGAFLNRLTKYVGWEGREIRLSFHDGSVWWRLWGRPHHWSSSTPKWMDGNFNLVDFALGRQTTTTRVIEERRVEVTMPEGSYAALAKVELHTTVRPRSPLKGFHHTTTIEMLEPIPVPGKGENSWDIGDDALHSLSVPGKTIESGIARTIESVLTTRRKRGGMYWAPGGDA